MLISYAETYCNLSKQNNEVVFVGNLFVVIGWMLSDMFALELPCGSTDINQQCGGKFDERDNKCLVRRKRETMTVSCTSLFVQCHPIIKHETCAVIHNDK